MSDVDQSTEQPMVGDDYEESDNMQQSYDNTQESKDIKMQKNFNDVVIASMTKMSAAIQSLEQTVSKQGTSTRGNTSSKKANKQLKLPNEPQAENGPSTSAEGTQNFTIIDPDVDALLAGNTFTNEYSEEDSEHVESESDANGEQLQDVIKQKLFSQNDMGPEINDKLADIANNRWAEKQEKEIANE